MRFFPAPRRRENAYATARTSAPFAYAFACGESAPTVHVEGEGEVEDVRDGIFAELDPLIR